MSISSQQSTAMEQPEGESLQSHELTVMVDQLIHDLQYSISRVSTDLTTKMDDMSTRLNALEQMLRQSLEGVPQTAPKKKEGSA
ncbi:hypothetical protein SAICODRAFT_17948 [Saitoella complicata NRRL Y-17804]|uniref:uncharacterized protein n=1 Tax=Saitoella complicata (strain BCRC 22490 / CBS 7301 / JCM 7358 / NBRC 10748 / NRRL Y-17804) TaxID=698492 RepID=UPI0008678EE4|nr:uncharacterized protein SAICODRAFT_17948 [Saitoella complicata NRRL Y-17804]ODQ54396.1 hypothetical protein SAICODRAFT_17948 [Saitoella complicata NRRL Y-17804]